MTARDALGITGRMINIAMPEGCHIRNMDDDYSVHSQGEYRMNAKERCKDA